jgi:hypothetical protein
MMLRKGPNPTRPYPTLPNPTLPNPTLPDPTQPYPQKPQKPQKLQKLQKLQKPQKPQIVWEWVESRCSRRFTYLYGILVVYPWTYVERMAHNWSC